MSAYRMTLRKVTGLTPNMAMLGKNVLFPVSLTFKPPEELVTFSVPFYLCSCVTWLYNLRQGQDVKGQGHGLKCKAKKLFGWCGSNNSVSTTVLQCNVVCSTVEQGYEFCAILWEN